MSRHMIPQMKDIVNRYQPDLLWTDGEWEHTDEEWKSRQFLAWLFNEPEVKDNIAENDRWGKKTRSLHGGFYTTEYGHKPDREKQEETDKIHPFEECRGIGGSFGYNRMENVEDYMTSDEIIHLLIDLVSKGGNLLLNVGPTADGRIPVIMQQRLLGVGRWLQENGEAIYETRTSKKFQETSIHSQIGKKLFITMKEGEVYIICTEWMDKPIVLKGFTTKNNASVSLLGQSQAVSVEKGGDTLIIVPPKLDKPIQEKPAWVYKISGINIQKTMKNLRDERLAPFPRTKYAVNVHSSEYYTLISHMDKQIGKILDALKKGSKTTIMLLLTAIICNFAHAQNPIIENIGMSDPHARVFNDTIYLYTGHDSHPEDTTWVMKEWRVFSSIDLVNWKLEGTISPKDNYMAENSTDCWAGDAAARNGMCYFYFSDRKRGVGVMRSNSPAGPFKDPLGKPLVAPLHDPTILIDDDKNRTPYIVYGDKSDSYYIARLNEDMISLAENPKPLEIKGEEWYKAPHWMDKNYIFKYQDTYYLSWGRDYAISTDVYGPYRSVGAVGRGHHLNEYAHGSFFWWKGQFYHIWCFYLVDGYKYRSSIITYCHFDNQGNILTDTRFLDKHFSDGVGNYNTSWPKIEAEWYYEIPDGIKKYGNWENGFVLTGIQDGDWVKFANTRFNKNYGKMTAQLRCIEGKGRIEVRLDSVSGELLGEATIEGGPGPDGFQKIIVKIKPTMGQRDLYVTFSGNQVFSLEMDFIRFID